eukprot:2685721-Pleurochrysis_carterae.AAC.4
MSQVRPSTSCNQSGEISAMAYAADEQFSLVAPRPTAMLPPPPLDSSTRGHAADFHSTESPSMHLCSQSGAESGGLCRETGILGPSGLDARPGQRWRHSALEMVPTDTQRSAATPALSARGCAASSQPPAEKDETARRLNAKRRASSACERLRRGDASNESKEGATRLHSIRVLC